MQKKNSQPIIVTILLICAVFITYSSVRTHDFINFDDDIYIYENSTIQQGISFQGLSWALTTPHASNWHPVTWVSHMLDVEFFGLNPGPHHLVSVFLHAVNATLLLFFLFAVTGRFWPSCLVSFLFALHPLHVESVAWASERKDVLSTFFLLLTLMTYSRYTHKNTLRSYLLSLVLFMLGLMSKPMLVSGPFLLLLLDFWPLQRSTCFKHTDHRHPSPKTLRFLLLEKIPFIVLAASSSIVTFLIQQQSGAVKSIQMMPMDLRLANALVSYCTYLFHTIWPTNLSLLYPFPTSIAPTKTLASGLFICLLSFIAIRSRKSIPELTTGWFWYLISLLPVIGIIQVGVQARADRYTYIPLIGIFLSLAFSLDRLERVKRQTKIVCSILICSLLGFLSSNQTQTWKNSETVFRKALQTTQANYTAHNYLAKELALENRKDEAEYNYQAALRLKPNYLEALVNYGILLAETGRQKKALQYLQSAHRQAPDNPKINNNLGNIYKSTGAYAQAIDAYQRALLKKADYQEALFNLANTYEKQDQFREAINSYRKAIQIAPDFPEAHNGLGVALARKGEIRAAIKEFKKAIQLRPNYQQALNNLRHAQEIIDLQ